MLEGQILNLILMAVLLVFSGFFSSSEAAFLSLERVRITHLANIKTPGAQRVVNMLDNPERLLSTILLGNNLVNIAFTAVITLLAISTFGDGEGLIIATILGTVLILIFGEIIPKTIAFHNAEKLSLWYARPLKTIEILLLPFVMILQWITRNVRGMIGGADTRSRMMSVTEVEVRSLIDIGEAEGTFESSEAEMLENVFRFGDIQVREVLTPRTEIIALQRGATLSQFLDIYSNNAHTRFPVYKDSVDDVIGIISSKDVLRIMSSRGLSQNDSVTDVIRDAFFVPETKRISELFDEMRRSGNQMAMIVDEYGGLAGLVTLKRLVEEVVGAVGEEGVALEEEYQEIDDNVFQIEGGMSIDEANEELKLGLPSGEFDTIAGFVLDELGHIPQKGEHLTYRDLVIQVVEMRNLKIETLMIVRDKLDVGDITR